MEQNKIGSWADINSAFSLAVVPVQECPARSEIEVQSLQVSGNYLPNECPLFRDIKTVENEEPTIANLWIKPGYMIEVDYEYQGKTYKILEMTDKGKKLDEFPDVIDGEQYEVWYRTFAMSNIESLPEANYSNAISLEEFCFSAHLLSGIKWLKLGACGNINMAFQGCPYFIAYLDNEGYNGEVQASSAFASSVFSSDTLELLVDRNDKFRGFVNSKNIQGLDMYAKSEFLITKEEYYFDLSNGNYRNCFFETQFRQSIGGIEVINELHNIVFSMPNAHHAFNTLKKVVNASGTFDPYLFNSCYELEVCEINNLRHDLNLGESYKLSIESLEFIVDRKDNDNEISITVYPEVYNNVSQELKDKALAKRINIRI